MPPEEDRATAIGNMHKKLVKSDVYSEDMIADRQTHAHTDTHRSTQPCIPPGSLNRVPASAGVKAGMSPLSGGR